MSRYTNPVPFINTINGAPISGAKLYFYETGTTTLKAIYSDSGFVTSTTNPQVADSSGRFSGDIFLDGIYAVVMKDASDVTIWSKDPVGDIVAGQFELWTNDNTYNIPEIVLGSDDQYYVSLIDANQGNDPTSSPTNWELFYLTRMHYKVGTAVDDTDIDGSNILALNSDGDYFTMTGTQQIDEILTEGVGRVIWLQAGSARILTHHATNLILLSGANITTTVGDVMCFHEYAVGDWRMLSYEKASGGALNEVAGNHKHGLTLSNDADADHDINVTAGAASDATNVLNLVLASEQTKQIDASWATGDDAGGLSSSLTVANSTTYHVFLVLISDTVEVLFDTSFTCANGVSDHAVTKYRRIGSIRTNGSANILGFTQFGATFQLSASIGDLATSSSTTSAASRTLSTPLGIKTIALIRGYQAKSGASIRHLLTSLDSADETPSSTNCSLANNAGADGVDGGQLEVMTNTSSQIRTRADATGCTLNISTYGWIDVSLGEGL